MSSPISSFNAQQVRAYTDDTFCFTRNGDVSDNMEALTNFVDRLDPKTATAMFAEELTATDLQEIAKDVNAQSMIGWCDGLAPQRKTRFFDVMATHLDGAQLDRLTHAFSRREDVVALSQSIAKHGSTDTKVEFIRAMRGHQIESDKQDVGARRPRDIRPGQEGKASTAMAIVLAGLKDEPARMEELLKESHFDSRLRVTAAALTLVGESNQGVAPTYDAKVLNDILSGLKADGFSAAKCSMLFTSNLMLRDLLSRNGQTQLPRELTTLRTNLSQIEANEVGGFDGVCERAGVKPMTLQETLQLR
jgi:hypothetical protein